MAGGLHYVVVVHGIGEQRLGETPLPVVSRFAEARRVEGGAEADVVTLGMIASGLEGRRWVSFEGLPAERAELDRPFLGVPADASDREGFRFVDVHWADLLDRDVALTGQEPRRWAGGLLGRLERKSGAKPPVWAREILQSLALTVTAASLGLSWRHRALHDRVVEGYLGDVQVYGEHPRTRGRAVRRFHDLMRELHDALDDDEKEAVRYTIVAHSLGSMMSFDALTFAAATGRVRMGEAPAEGLPLEGYLDEPEPPSVAWLDRVHAFVTLGSPIDKFLTLWWFHYRHLARPEAWMDERAARIPHFNYCEEQDPVGHHLDLAAGTPAYARLFEAVEDRVTVRYGVPGLAHLAYWKDAALFRWIVRRAVDGDEDATPPPFFHAGVYRSILRFSYDLPPFATGLALWALASWARHDADLVTSAVAGSGLVVVAWLGKQLVDLSVWWRQVLGAKRKRAVAEVEAGAKVLARTGEDDRDVEARRRLGRRFRLIQLPGIAVALFAAGLASGWASSALRTANEKGGTETWWEWLARPDVVSVLLSGLATAIFGRLIVKAKVAAWSAPSFFSGRLATALGCGAAVAGGGLAAGRLWAPAWLLDVPLVQWGVLLDVASLAIILGTAFLYTMLRLRDVRARLAEEPDPISFVDYVGAASARPPER